MTEKCFDIGTMQAFLDGELALEMTETLARHVSVCDDCARLLAESEEESAFAFSALEYELNALVPTQRLWTKINDSIAREKKSFWKPIFAFLTQPQTAAFASLIFVALISVTLLSLKPNAPTNYTARQTDINQQRTVQRLAENKQTTPVVQPPQVLPIERDVEPVTFKRNKNESRAIKTVHVEPRGNPKIVNPPINETEVEAPAANENVVGEESYIKTIATLNTTVASRKDEVLSPSARFAFERDLAVTDDAIKQMKREVRKNPNNEAAKQILRASYQNKIDLLNSVADKTELMASLK
jgi:hypothetical protein